MFDTTKFCIIIGIDNDSNIFIETPSKFDKENTSDISELLDLLMGGDFNESILAHLTKISLEKPDCARVIKKILSNLKKPIDIAKEPPLIDPLMIIK